MHLLKSQQISMCFLGLSLGLLPVILVSGSLASIMRLHLIFLVESLILDNLSVLVAAHVIHFELVVILSEDCS